MGDDIETSRSMGSDYWAALRWLSKNQSKRNLRRCHYPLITYLTIRGTTKALKEWKKVVEHSQNFLEVDAIEAFKPNYPMMIFNRDLGKFILYWLNMIKNNQLIDSIVN